LIPDPGPHEWVDGTDDSDAVRALEALAQLRDWVDEREAVLVRKAWRDGWTWPWIARALGRSKQAVWEKYRALEIS
jgi:hypothetical protein